MDYQEIVKNTKALKIEPNFSNLEKINREWSWNNIETDLDIPEKKFNQAYICVDRHAEKTPNKLAMIWESADGNIENYSFLQFKNESNKFANAMINIGLKKSDRVFFFTDRIPELYFACFGVLKAGGIMAPLFSAFGPEPVAERFNRAEGSYIVTTPNLLNKIEAIRDQMPTLKEIIVISHRSEIKHIKNILHYHEIMKGQSEKFEISESKKEDWSVMHFTSGTTGLPKGAAHVHNALISHYATGKYVLDLHPEDIYWCTADPGWVTGTSYGMFAPWSNGVTSVIYEGGFSAKKWYGIIKRHKVSVWYTAPTAIRLLMKAGSTLPQSLNLESLRYIMSVGEPLNPEGVIWGEEAFNLAIHDNWWQTETGSIMVANYPSMNIRPGSMGKPFPGIKVAIIDDNFKEIIEPDIEGQLAIKPTWPSMFKAYWNDEERYQSRFKGEWYITGDRAKKDKDGYFWFIGRDDDVINTAGHLVGPFEVESTLIEHPAVAEAGVIGKPDPVAMEIVKAFVSLSHGYEPSDELRRQLIGHCRNRLGPGTAPREIEFIETLPKTRSGKIMRRLLKARELGLPEGDTSTLEDD
jgi:acetyl-CoA synthetase